MSSSKQLVAFVIGAGPNVGLSVAANFKSKGYAVAVSSRNPDIGALKAQGYYGVEVDTDKLETIKAAFDSIKLELGEPNVVVFNAYSATPVPSPSDPLSLPLEAYMKDVNTSNALYAAAQAALSGFRAHSKGTPKAFLATGNIFPSLPPASIPFLVGITAQKISQAYLLELFYESYKSEGIRFHFATMTSPEGLIPDDFYTSGALHGEVYYDLATREIQAPWDYRFTNDGKQLGDYTIAPEALKAWLEKVAARHSV